MLTTLCKANGKGAIARATYLYLYVTRASYYVLCVNLLLILRDVFQGNTVTINLRLLVVLPSSKPSKKLSTWKLYAVTLPLVAKGHAIVRAFHVGYGHVASALHAKVVLPSCSGSQKRNKAQEKGKKNAKSSQQFFPFFTFPLVHS